MCWGHTRICFLWFTVVSLPFWLPQQESYPDFQHIQNPLVKKVRDAELPHQLRSSSTLKIDVLYETRFERNQVWDMNIISLGDLQSSFEKTFATSLIRIWRVCNPVNEKEANGSLQVVVVACHCGISQAGAPVCFLWINFGLRLHFLDEKNQ